jgi:hypothetical protein
LLFQEAGLELDSIWAYGCAGSDVVKRPWGLRVREEVHEGERRTDVVGNMIRERCSRRMGGSGGFLIRIPVAYIRTYERFNYAYAKPLRQAPSVGQ